MPAMPTVSPSPHPARLRRAPAFAASLIAASLAVSGVPLAALDPDTALHQYRLDTWGGPEGIVQGSILSILQGSGGYLWIGSYEDLSRFDGVALTTFGKATSPAIRSEAIQALAEEPAGTFWLAMENGGLVRINDRATTLFRTTNGLPGNQVHALAPGRADGPWAGDIWAATDNGLARLTPDGRILVASSEDTLAGATAYSLTELEDGAFWVGTNRGLAQLDPTSDPPVLRAAPSFLGINADVTALRVDRRGRLWAGTVDGDLYAFDNGSLLHHLELAEIRALTEDRDANLWIATYGQGLYRRHENGRLDQLGIADGLPSDAVWAVEEDREGNLWIGMEGAGLARLQESRFLTLTHRDGLPHPRIWTLHERRSGGVWMGTDGAGVAYLTADGRVERLDAEALRGAIVRSLLERENGDLWIGTEDGLLRWRTGRITEELRDLHSNITLSLLEDHRGALWIGTSGNGLLRHSPDGQTQVWTTADGLPDDAVGVLFEDRDRRLWIGTDRGIARIEDGVPRAFPELDGLSVRDLHQDPDGNMWIGTRSRGLARWKDGQVSLFSISDGLHNDAVYRILEDAESTFWMCSNKGVQRLARAELEAYARGERPRLQPEVFGTADGLPSLECLGGNQHPGLKSRDGRFWFPTVEGLSWTVPTERRPNLLPPPVHLESVLVDGTARTSWISPAALWSEAQVRSAAPLVLPPGTRELAFAYTATSLASPSRVRFRYRLEGYDPEWIDAGPRRTAFYTNMAPGAYTFRVMASNNDGVWNEEGVSLNLVLRPAFHQTGLFKILLALGAALLAFALHRYGVRNLVRRHRELKRTKQQLEAKTAEMESFTYTVAHDLKSPLFTLEGLLDVLEQDLGRGATEHLPDHLTRLRGGTRKMRELLDELLELSRAGKVVGEPRAVSLDALVRDALDSVGGAIAERGIRIQIAPDLPEVSGDPIRLLQVMQNLVENAVKYMGDQENPRLEIAASPGTEGRVVLHLYDNGRGIDPGDLNKIFDLYSRVATETEGSGLGLATARRIVDAHGGWIWAESEGAGRGATFYVELPEVEE